MSVRIRLELARIETKIVDLQDHLDAISPEHVLYKDLQTELNDMKTQLETFKTDAKNAGLL